MTNEGAPVGLLVAAIGAAVLAVSVFTPWYGVSLTAAGVAQAQQEISAAAQEYGNPALQAKLSEVSARANSLVGRQLFTVSAHRALKRSWLLLLIAGVAFLAALLRLADMRGLFYTTGGQIAAMGFVAFLLVLGSTTFGPALPPTIGLSLQWGIWLALVCSGGIFFGGLNARTAQRHRRTAPKTGPGPPPIGRDISSPLAMFRQEQ